LPGDAYNCLIVPTENLADSQHDAIINLVNSTAGQDAYEFAEVMARTNFPDGSIMLANLHVNGKLIKVATDQIEMTPNTQFKISLAELNQIIAEQRGVSVQDLAVQPDNQDKPAKNNVEVQEVGSAKDISPKAGEDVTKTVEERRAEAAMSPEDKAAKLRSDADRLYKEAAKLRKEAEDLSPTKKKEK
jgi:ribosome-binding protein aMBF1 (putative translation factor)